jgi:putative iron-only hydrogenase system regulator
MRYPHNILRGGFIRIEVTCIRSDPEEYLMEKRIGVVAILVNDADAAERINAILHDYSRLILGRLGLPLRDKRISVISLVVEGTTDDIGALTGKLGRLPGTQVKSLLTKYREDEHGDIHDDTP